MNPSFEILYLIVNRLVISANTLFHSDSTENEEEIFQFFVVHNSPLHSDELFPKHNRGLEIT